jgi:lipopolysaccharide biosynthesis protein
MKIIAFYLPQFHPIAENNEWWGPGFTEWHNVAKARPLFKGHAQPRLPGELGFYDLRLAETRADQAALAREYGVHGFCYWHYWFGGKRILERPAHEMLTSSAPDFPFCLGWANESWTGVWHGSPNKILLEQTYSREDAAEHYKLLRTYFHDNRYIKVDGRPMFYVYKPKLIPSSVPYIEHLRELAKADGFPELYVVGTWSPNPRGRYETTAEVGVDAAVITNITGRDSLSKLSTVHAALEKARHIFGKHAGPKRVDYESAVEAMLPDLSRFGFRAFNCVVSNWDNTPRSGRAGLVFTDSTPEKFGRALETAKNNLAKAGLHSSSENFVFLKSWNEWAEGNYVEPDQVHGRRYLDEIRRVQGAGK